MAKWSVLKHGSGLDSAEHAVSRRTHGFSDANNRPLGEDRLGDSQIDYIYGLRSLFYRVLDAFLKDVAVRACVHPVLAKIGDGQLVDLFELYCTVRRRGGYEALSESDGWGLVTQELGFDQSSVSSLKLMHFKYLKEFDLWLRGRRRNLPVENKKWESVLNDFGSLSLELEMGLKVFLYDEPGERKIQSRASRYDHENKTKVNHRVEMDHGIAESVAILRLEPTDTGPGKRKRETLRRMLLWVIDTAKHPDDPADSLVPEQSRLKDQALLARYSLFLRRTRQHNLGTPETNTKKKPKAHPPNYRDHRESLAYDKSLPALGKSPSSLPRYLHPISQSRSARPKEELENCFQINTPERLKESKDPTTCVFPSDESNPDPKSVGPLFQADVPKWTGIISESDPKWLGTKVWPLENDTESLSGGRASLCSCLLPDSAECIRFHVADERLRVKRQLGYLLFYEWRFNCMGEEVSLRWTPEEEARFKGIVRLNPPSQGKCFWDDLFRCFPKKTREDLVSYYFNVFLLRRRCYQNHVTPKEIDSDDDDSDFGTFEDYLEQKGAQTPCSLNKQCIDWPIDESVEQESAPSSMV